MRLTYFAIAVGAVAMAVATAVLTMPAGATVPPPTVPPPTVHTPEGVILVVTALGYEAIPVARYETEGQCYKAKLMLQSEAPRGVTVHCEVQA